MRRIIFYSWQSDTPNAYDRGFIQKALEDAASAIAADDTIAVEPVVDRDTQNVPGAPDIASTIFAKISAADLFVADVTITTRGKGKRPTPNPNVLIELGYALKALGHERVILVFNRAFGKVEELPFDLKMRRALVYEMSEAATDRTTERKALVSKLDSAMRTALVHIPAPNPNIEETIPAAMAIENAQPNRVIVLRRNLEEVLGRLDALEPRKHRDGGTAEELINAIGKTQEIVAEFSKIAETAAAMDDLDASIELIRWFGRVFERYGLPQGFSGQFSEADFDYFRFLGHEMFITVIAYLMREQRWTLLQRVLDEPIPMSYVRNSGPGNVDWYYASEHIRLLLQESQNRKRVCLHADLLHGRHTGNGGLAAIAPLEDLMNGDFLLFLKSQHEAGNMGFRGRYWRAWSCLYLNHPPAFVRNAERTRVAEQIAEALGTPDVGGLKRLLIEKGSELERLFRNGFWDYPIEKEDIERIGTR